MTKLLAAQRELGAVHPDERVIWQLAVDRARSLVGSDGALIEMVEGEELVCRAVSGKTGRQSGQRGCIRDDLTGIAASREEVLLIDDLRGSDVAGAEVWLEQGVRSVAAVPVPHQYYLIAVLTVVSREPFAFGQSELAALQLLTYGMAGAINQVVAQGAKNALLMEHTRTIVALRESEERFRGAFDLAPIGMALVAVDGTWMQVNRTLCEILGRTENELTDRALDAVVHPDDLIEHTNQVRRLVAGETSRYQAEMRWYHKTGRVIWVMLSACLLRDGQGNPRYLIGQIQDITQRKRNEEQIRNSLREKEVLLKEIHHRVKNNLQVVSSLLSLQSSYSSDPTTQELFRESQNRVRSMALIHEKLYRSQDCGRVNLHEYVGSLVSMLFRVYGTDPTRVKWKAQIDQRSTLNIDTAVPVGLIIHELVSNALKYAFADPRPGRISITFRADDDRRFVLIYADDGIGLPKDFEIDKAPSLGLRLVKILTGQLNGQLSLQSDSGTQFTIRFKELKK